MDVQLQPPRGQLQDLAEHCSEIRWFIWCVGYISTLRVPFVVVVVGVGGRGMGARISLLQQCSRSSVAHLAHVAGARVPRVLGAKPHLLVRLLRGGPRLGDGVAAFGPDVERPLEARLGRLGAKLIHVREAAEEIELSGRRAGPRRHLEGNLQLAARLDVPVHVPGEQAGAVVCRHGRYLGAGGEGSEHHARGQLHGEVGVEKRGLDAAEALGRRALELADGGLVGVDEHGGVAVCGQRRVIPRGRVFEYQPECRNRIRTLQPSLSHNFIRT